jgi:photosystem II stability/assembly factor-like uncharacterized protein
MTPFTYLKIAILLLFALLDCKSQWLPQRNGLPAVRSGGGGSRAIAACNANNAVVAAWSAVFITTNGGALWREVTVPGERVQDFADVAMADSLHIWLCNNFSGWIDATTDGGNTWTTQYRGPVSNHLMDYIECFDAKHCVSAGSAGVIDPNGSVNSISIPDRNHIWVAGWWSDTLYAPLQIYGSSVDGGAHWRQLTTPTGSGYGLTSFRDTLTGLIATFDDIIYQTTDGGVTWAMLRTPEQFLRMKFADASTVWAVGNNTSTIYKSTDVGVTWTTAYQSDFSLRSLHCIDAGHCYCAGEKGVIVYTSDGGTSWNIRHVDTTKGLFAVSFGNALHGCAAGQAGYLVRTTDGGLTWTEQPTGTKYTIYALSFLNASTGIASGANGTILRTVDGGASWSDVSTQNRNYLHDAAWASLGDCWLVGDNSIILKSTDAGLTWTTKFGKATEPNPVLQTTNGGVTWENKNTAYLYADLWWGWTWVQFVTADIGYAVDWESDPDGLYKTTDGGASWRMCDGGNLIDLLRFSNENIGIVTDWSGTMRRTVDGGATWITLPFHCSICGYELEFLPGDPSHVWYSDFSQVYLSSDTGWTWKRIQSIPYVRDIVFTDVHHGWMLAENEVYHTDDGSAAAVGNGTEEWTKISLDQNFPNPFTSYTNLRYEISSPGVVTVKVFTLLGNEVATVVSGYHVPGNYIAVWNRGQLPCGLYYYQLISAGKTITKTLLVH